MKALALLLLGLALAGCGTVIPNTVPSSAASFDGNDQNSGMNLNQSRKWRCSCRPSKRLE